MKAGFRSPSISKSLKARTTGKIKRSMTKSVNPLYGKKGMGFVKDPEKSIKNAAYHKITFGVEDVANAMRASKSPNVGETFGVSSGKPFWVVFILALALLIFGCLLLLKTWWGLAMAVSGIIVWIVQYATIGKAKQ